MEIILDLGDGNLLKFEDPQSFAEWVEKELENWKWLNETTIGQNVWREIKPPLNAAQNAAISFSQNPSDVNLESALTQSVRNLQDMIAARHYILSESTLGSFLQREQGADSAFAAEIAQVARIDANQNPGNRLGTHKAIVALSDFERGLTKSGASSTARLLGKIADEFQSKLADFDAKSAAKLADLSAAVEEREQKVEQSTRNLAANLARHKGNTRDEQLQLRNETKERLDKFIADSGSEITKFTETLTAQIALQAPIEYWKDKRKWHRIGTAIAAFAFVLFTCAGVKLLYISVASFEGGLVGFFSFWKDASIGTFGVYATILAMALVFLRVVYRLFASQLHLWNDSSERITMIQTYLALSERGHAKEEFMGALLNRLFAPATDGVVKDDFGSIGPTDMIAKNLMK